LPVPWYARVPLILLAVAFLAVYAWPILNPDLPSAARTHVGIWVAFAADYVVRLVLAEHRWAFVRRS
jgi:voltage-gated potassium channel